MQSLVAAAAEQGCNKCKADKTKEETFKTTEDTIKTTEKTVKAASAESRNAALIPGLSDRPSFAPRTSTPKADGARIQDEATVARETFASLPSASLGSSDGKTEAYVTHVLSHDRFFVQRKLDSLASTQLSAKLQKVGNAPSGDGVLAGQPPKVGEYLLGRYSFDKMWYR